ncbi:hypothetical protein [Microbacterium sp. NIBRBAC000506063]|uniref:hypothetical protein n=1 Tax=Microbacterium sp. NIBRBAC000506063 TaxID=2734618 RepID=UPI001CB6FCCB|nr:hypothetical protein [Microbacterium sp. NIBRBAC000506063]
MAVIAHDTRQILALEAELAAREVPTRSAGVQRPLASENAVRDIVRIVALALKPAGERTAQELAEALCSPFGGLDAVGLRRLRARLRHRELADGGTTPAMELLRQAMEHPAHLTLIDAPEARVAGRFATTLAETAAAAAAGETAHDLLWRVWERSGLQNRWRAAAEQPGARRSPARSTVSWRCSMRPSASWSARPTSARRCSSTTSSAARSPKTASPPRQARRRDASHPGVGARHGVRGRRHRRRARGGVAERSTARRHALGLATVGPGCRPTGPSQGRAAR